MGCPLSFVCALALVTGALPFDPAIDGAREPPSTWSLGAGLDRLDDTLGVWVEARSPRFFDDVAAVGLGGGVGWFPGRARLSADASVVDAPWSPFGQLRLRFEMATRMAESPHRIYLALGPSAIFPSDEVSSDGVGIGLHGGLGVELFAGDRFFTFPLALTAELGATAHLARADAALGSAANAAPLATGFALQVGLRYYLPGEDGGRDEKEDRRRGDDRGASRGRGEVR